MHEILTTLDEHSGDLFDELTDQGGFTEDEATVFLREARPAVVASWVWNSSQMPREALRSEEGLRALLSGMSGDLLAPRVGLSSARAWHGLRTLVPAVLRASRAYALGSTDRPV